jgi:hypothetical protein
MCALCAALARTNHWSDAAGHAEFEANGRKVTRRAERRRRVALCRLVLAHYGLELADHGGSSFVVTNAEGAAAEVFQLAELWPAAARLAGRPCDPLDPALLRRLAGVSA